MARSSRRGVIAMVCAFAALAAFAVPARASITIGQLAPGVSPDGYLEGVCGSGGPDLPLDYLQRTVSSGNSYVVPGPGTITSWSHNAGDGTGMTLTFKVFRPFGGALFTAVGHSGPFPLLPSTINAFPAQIPVSTGDIIGLRVPAIPDIACDFKPPEGDPGELATATDVADGQSGSFIPSAPFYRVNVTAVFEPSNAFSVGKITRNSKKGTATLVLEVPNAGALTVAGKGVKAASTAGALTAKAVSPGNVTVTIRTKGKQRKRLNATGKVTVKPKITYTPNGGAPSSQKLKVKLRKS